MKRLLLAASTATTFLFVHAETALAAAADSEKKPVDLPYEQLQTQTSAPGAGSGSLSRTLFGLLMVVAIIYGLYWILKQIKKTKEEAAHGSGLHSLATLPLGPNRSLHMIRAGREIVLVGVAEHGVSPIRSYSEEEALEAGLIGNGPGSDSSENGTSNGNGNGNGTIARTGKAGFATPGTALKTAVDSFRQKTVRK